MLTRIKAVQETYPVSPNYQSGEVYRTRAGSIVMITSDPVEGQTLGSSMVMGTVIGHTQDHKPDMVAHIAAHTVWLKSDLQPFYGRIEIEQKP